MILPKAFQLHECRLSNDARVTIEFQYERLGLNPNNTKVFLERFLKISRSPTLPPDDFEILYLASKIAYMLASYDYFETDYYKANEQAHDGARIWFALSKGAQGDIEEAIKILTDVKANTELSGDFLPYIESLGILAQFYFLRGSKDKKELEIIIAELDKFKEKYQLSLPDFDHIFMPAYLIKERIYTQQLPPKELIKEITKILDLAEKNEDYYWKTHLQLDLVVAYLKSNDLDEAKKILEFAIDTLKNFKFL
ncbi:MAG: hypothetical protein ACFFDW_14115, partial [Candidatus Thorarchaeota archaeon]